MKTTSFLPKTAALTLVIFMSVSSIANPALQNSGETTKTGLRNQISSTEATTSSMASNMETDFSYLRFEAEKFADTEGTEVTELPVSTEFNYLRFDVTDFNRSNATEITDMPENEFDHLRFDVEKQASLNTPQTDDELPVR